MDASLIVGSVRKTGRLVTIDTGYVRYGIGSEIVASVSAEAFGSLRSAPLRLGLPDYPTPSSRGMIANYYPNADSIIERVGTLVGVARGPLDAALATLSEQRKSIPIDVPDPFFKGPF